MRRCVASKRVKQTFHRDDDLLEVCDNETLDVEVGVAFKEEVTLACCDLQRVSVDRHGLIEILQ